MQTRLATERARELRRASPEVERHLWGALRARRLGGWKWRRQSPIGRYFVDFVCLERRIIVELDGGQHADQETCDATRTAFLEAQGFRVLRFWNSRVIENRTGVCDEILAACGGEAPRVVMREQANVERFLARVDGG